MYRTLNATNLLETSDKLHKRIVGRFPDAGLGEVAGELSVTVREGVKRAAEIASPNVPLRVGLLLLLALVVVGAILSLKFEQQQGTVLGRFWQWLDATRGAAVYLAVVVFFFWTLET